MGVSNIQGDKPDAVPDSKQRERKCFGVVTYMISLFLHLSTEYFDGSQSAQGKDKNATEQVRADPLVYDVLCSVSNCILSGSQDKLEERLNKNNGRFVYHIMYFTSQS